MSTQLIPSVVSPRARRHFLVKGLVACGGALLGWRADASPETGTDPHEHHHHEMNLTAAVKRSEANYKVPTLMLMRNDGRTAAFPKEIDDGRMVLLNFIYTSCTTVCPLTSHVFSQVQKMLSKDLGKVHMASISIDPEYDTPERLTAYARKYQAGNQWQYYTGTLDASIAMQKAFDVYRGDKMNHIPITFLRAAPGKPWVRLDGFANPDDLVRELRNLAKVT